jgi:hypothetical protein
MNDSTDVNAADNSLCTPMDYAHFYHHIDTVDVIKEFGGELSGNVVKEHEEAAPLEKELWGGSANESRGGGEPSPPEGKETWEAHWDNDTNCAYYYNYSTGESTWEKPVDFKEDLSSAAFSIVEGNQKKTEVSDSLRGWQKAGWGVGKEKVQNQREGVTSVNTFHCVAAVRDRSPSFSPEPATSPGVTPKAVTGSEIKVENRIMEKMQEQMQAMQMSMLTQMQTLQAREQQVEDSHEEGMFTDENEMDRLRKEAMHRAEDELREKEMEMEVEMERLRKDALKREQELELKLKMHTDQAENMKNAILQSKTDQSDLDSLMAEQLKGEEKLRQVAWLNYCATPSIIVLSPRDCLLFVILILLCDANRSQLLERQAKENEMARKVADMEAQKQEAVRMMRKQKEDEIGTLVEEVRVGGSHGEAHHLKLFFLVLIQMKRRDDMQIQMQMEQRQIEQVG